MESDGSCTIDLAIEDPRWGREIADIEALCRRSLETGLALAGPPVPVELAVVLTTDARIRELNARYRGRHRATDVLSFPALTPDELAAAGHRPAPLLLGDILLAFETVRAEAAREGKPFDAHFAHLLVHGLLHLLGHDHRRQAEALLMEDLERRILAALDLPDPYAATVP